MDKIRKSPSESATNFSERTIKIGNDKQKWVVKKLENGTHRWIPYKKRYLTPIQPSTHYTLSTFDDDETKDQFLSSRKQCAKGRVAIGQPTKDQFLSSRKQCANVDTLLKEGRLTIVPPKPKPKPPQPNVYTHLNLLEEERLNLNSIGEPKPETFNKTKPKPPQPKPGEEPRFRFKIARKSGNKTKPKPPQPKPGEEPRFRLKIARKSGKITKLTAADRGTGSRKRCIKQSANKKFESYTNKMKSKSRSPKKNIIFLRKSNHPDKKLMVTIGNKTIYFGAKNYSDYNKHKDKLRMLRYSNRHRLRENWGKSGIKTAGFWSKWILWNKPGLLASIKDTEKRFNICINYV